jgi:hypothetical protein
LALDQQLVGAVVQRERAARIGVAVERLLDGGERQVG